ncbi:hypothetical protein XENTR_v10016925 [Xenopus tropicalis]|nr:hypothetical protein XENTR_v10016925 [Xenopus tropicalis]
MLESKQKKEMEFDTLKAKKKKKKTLIIDKKQTNEQDKQADSQQSETAISNNSDEIKQSMQLMMNAITTLNSQPTSNSMVPFSPVPIPQFPQFVAPAQINPYQYFGYNPGH